MVLKEKNYKNISKLLKLYTYHSMNKSYRGKKKEAYLIKVGKIAI